MGLGQKTSLGFHRKAREIIRQLYKGRGAAPPPTELTQEAFLLTRSLRADSGIPLAGKPGSQKAREPGSQRAREVRSQAAREPGSEPESQAAKETGS